jgi:hypothetical protein
MHKNTMHVLPWVVFLVAFLLLISHLFGWPTITIDGTTLILLAILVISPFLEQVRRVRFGELEAEIAPAEIDKVAREADSRLGTGETTDAVPLARRDELLSLADRYHVLALAKLRMELEQTLNRLYASSTPEVNQRRHRSLNQLVGMLVQSEALSP